MNAQIILHILTYWFEKYEHLFHLPASVSWIHFGTNTLSWQYILDHIYNFNKLIVAINLPDSQPILESYQVPTSFTHRHKWRENQVTWRVIQHLPVAIKLWVNLTREYALNCYNNIFKHMRNLSNYPYTLVTVILIC